MEGAQLTNYFFPNVGRTGRCWNRVWGYALMEDNASHTMQQDKHTACRFLGPCLDSSKTAAIALARLVCQLPWQAGVPSERRKLTEQSGILPLPQWRRGAVKGLHTVSTKS